jgi:hypothetical protein
MKKKAIVAVVALVLVLCCAMGGTLAWLVDSTTEVKNTFTYGDINISLWEHELNEDGLTLSEDVFTGAVQTGFKMIPGNKIEKHPTVTVKANSEACWLFVKVEKSSNFDTFMTCSVNTAENEWNELSSAASGNYKVYYREVAATTVDTNFAVLANNSVSVKETVTKDKLNALDANSANNYPTLTFTAYAVQRDTNITTAAQAWDIAMGNN